jgi:hypothetical protein
VAAFRQYVEDNDYIDMQMDFDNIATRGMAEAQGTPWGTNDFLYEATLAIETVGEFLSDEFFTSLVPLAQINNTAGALAFQSQTEILSEPTIGMEYPVKGV